MATVFLLSIVLCNFDPVWTLFSFRNTSQCDCGFGIFVPFFMPLILCLRFDVSHAC